MSGLSPPAPHYPPGRRSGAPASRGARAVRLGASLAGALADGWAAALGGLGVGVVCGGRQAIGDVMQGGVLVGEAREFAAVARDDPVLVVLDHLETHASPVQP